MAVVEVVDEADIALVVSTVASVFFAHPASTATMQQLAMRVVRCSLGMGPPVQVTDGFARRLPSETNVKREIAGGKFAAVTGSGSIPGTFTCDCEVLNNLTN